VNFIPAQESKLFKRVFRVYVRLLLKRRFKKIWVHQQYHPIQKDRTVYFLNHNSWWDGLIPFLLNEYRFNQQGRAMMEHKQMKKYRFFKKLGAFSMVPHNRSHNLASLRYAVKSMQRPNASLFVYPQGEILPAGSQIHFKNGIGWLCKQMPNVDFVPIGIHMHTMRHDKPELHIWVGKPVSITTNKDLKEITASFEQIMQQLLDQLINTAGISDEVYEPFF
jgi:1-acyl-sn-glycerol-3-phosphate acyltransferase